MPPVVAIALALLTKEVYLSLFAGCALGALLAAEFHPWIAFDTLFNTMIDSVDFSILMFMILLGMIVMLMQESGGTRAYGEWASGHLKSKRSALVTTSLLGALIFVDDYFNCLTVGSVMRPVTDKYKVSRAKLAYIIDATAAPVCIIAPISSWAAAVNSYVPAGSSMSGFEMFVKTIPFNLYAILTLYMVFFTSIVGFDFGLMKKHEENAAKGDLFTSGGEEFQNQETKDPTEGGKYAKGKVIDLIAPMVVMIATAIAAMIWTGHLNGGQNLVEDFANCSSSEALVFAGLVTVGFLLLLYLPRRVIGFKDFMNSVPEGGKLMAGDNVLDFSLSKFVDFAKEKNTSCVMCHEENELKKQQKTAIITLDNSDLITSYEEKPKEPKGNLAVPPFYCYRACDVKRIQEALNNGCGYDAPGSFAAWLSKQTPMHAYIMTGKRYDIGDINSYEYVKSVFSK